MYPCFSLKIIRVFHDGIWGFYWLWDEELSGSFNVGIKELQLSYNENYTFIIVNSQIHSFQNKKYLSFFKMIVANSHAKNLSFDGFVHRPKEVMFFIKILLGSRQRPWLKKRLLRKRCLEGFTNFLWIFCAVGVCCFVVYLRSV